ncbi:tetratricopeptide repeat protein [Thiomicrorhabdus sp. 6S3-12]|uniref:tetratricopeptide repeat protein n=1 Tax=Thiomicrorhabdus sp. 6S3-12 TaxID=2819681 RepID=UPI001AAD96E1|nr:tetratricopeptide repeat protein [Thiomicrorhabdus sp. 6S3-12]MBO1923434.1 sel1 repeat family protein [Thiomicrorhabdus sp. 6S3-12]
MMNKWLLTLLTTLLLSTNSFADFDFEKACNEGRGDACSVAALAYQKKNNNSKALEFFQKGCIYRDANSCAKSALMYESGRGVNKNTAKAVDFYGKACEYGDTDSCNYLGAKYYNGDGIKQNVAMSIKLFQTACNGGNADGCQNVIKLYQAYCDGGHAFSCNALGAMYFKGQGVNKNAGRAAELVVKSCNLGDANGCYLSGIAYEQGVGGTQNLNTALQYYQKSCQMQNDKGCKAAQKLQSTTQEPKQPSSQSHSQAPVAKPEQATKPATITDHRQQNETEAFYSQALKLANTTEGCNREAYDLFKQAANQGHIEASNTLAFYAAKGFCEAKSYSRMIHWYENAANHGDTNAMFTLGKIYEEGDYDQHADKDKALYWFEKCAKQGKQGCQKAYNRLRR